MLKGQLWATSDINLVNQAMMQGFKVIYLGDPISLDPMYKERFVVSTALTPDYQTMSLMIDGNVDGFVQMYIMSLNTPSAMEMFSAIFACLYRGNNVIFFLPPEASGLNFVQYLLQFIEYNFGITTQTNTTQFMFNPEFAGRIIEFLYLSNLVSAQEYLINATSMNKSAVEKLVNELRPVVKDPTDLNQILDWFRNYKKQLIETNKPLINGIQYAGEVSDYKCC